MESHRLNELAQKFWQGECSEAEENLLRTAVANQELPPEHQALTEYLHFAKSEHQHATLDRSFDLDILSQLPDAPAKARLIPLSWWRVAASVALIVGLGWGANQLMVPVVEDSPLVLEEDTFKASEADLALEEVKKALMLVSNQMNTGMAHASLLKEFHNATEELANQDKDEKTYEFN